MSPELFALLVAAAILLGVIAIAVLIVVFSQTRQSQRINRRLDPEHQRRAAEADAQDEDPRLLGSIASGGRRVENFVDTKQETPKLLAQAGWRSVDARNNFYIAQALTPVLAAIVLIAGYLLFGERVRPVLWLLIGFALMALSILLPRMMLRSSATARRERIRSEVPLFIHLLVLLFEAGLSTRQALSSLVKEGRGVLPELGRECGIAMRQIEAGADTGDVFKNLSDTLEVADLASVLGVLRQVDRYGGEVREPLLDVLKLLEERRSLDLRERVNLTSGRMTVVMILFFFPALMIFVGGPAFVSIVRALRGVAG